MISVHSCVRGRISVHLPEEWQFAVHSCVGGKIPVHLLEGWWFQFIHVWGVWYRCIYLRSNDLRCIHVWGVRFRCIWGMMMLVHSFVRKILWHLLEGWWFRWIHVWGVGYRCFYLRSDNFGSFVCEGSDSGAFTWGMMISVHTCVRGRISVYLPEEWRFSLHSCVRGGIAVYLRDDDFGALMC